MAAAEPQQSATAATATVEGNRLTHEQQAAKLRLVVETAEEVWG